MNSEYRGYLAPHVPFIVDAFCRRQLSIERIVEELRARDVTANSSGGEFYISDRQQRAALYGLVRFVLRRLGFIPRGARTALWMHREW